LVGAAVGAGIANYAGGSDSITGSNLDGNQANGGRGNTTSGSGVLFAGLGAGGGIFNYLGNYNSAAYGQFTSSVVTVSNSLIDLNESVGGGGGNGVGGGIADLLSASTTVSNSILTLNQANGGTGNGLGGGAYNDASSTLALAKSLVTLNLARGAQGIGGGIYNLGTLDVDALTFILLNLASTSGNNIGS
jgi:hypothetical protein